MKSWNELKDIQLPLTYGNLLTIFTKYDMELAEECKVLMDGGYDGGFTIQSQRHAIAELLRRIKCKPEEQHGEKTILGEPK